MWYNAFMGMIRIYQGKSKPAKKKPGWQKAEAEYAAWEAKLASQTLFGSSKPKMKPAIKKIDPVVRGPVLDKDRLVKGKSLGTIVTGGTKQVVRPEILYKDNPEMLERELAARSRKFNVAPAYNKGGDVFVTEEELANQLRGNKRRP